MKKLVLFIPFFALCTLLFSAGFSEVGQAKETKKKPAQSEQKATTSEATTSKNQGSSTKTSTKSISKSKVSVKPQEISTSKSAETELLLRSLGTSMSEIQAQMHQSSPSASSSAAGEQINWQVISGGGGTGTSTNFGLVSVVGQTAVGIGSSASFGLSHGFLQSFSSGCCEDPGDFNDDGLFNIADVTSGIARIFSGGAAPSCQDQADANGDNLYNIADVTFGIARIFSGGAAPICGTTGA